MHHSGADGPPRKLAREVSTAAGSPGAARTLLLDLDGTLAPIAPTAKRAAVPDATLASLSRLIDAGWTVVPVSGRPAAQIRSLVPIDGIQPFGSHGLETENEQGACALPVAGEILDRLRLLETDAPSIAAAFPGVQLERKPAGLAFHDRQLAETALASWRPCLELWLASRDLRGLEILEGKRVLEIRPQGAHKGRVVHTLAERLGLEEEDRSFVAIGDDVTDEDMFREIRGLGLAVRVGDDEAPTHASRRLDSPTAVGDFLAALAGCAEDKNR
jgi:trehalose-phosphatase